MVNQPSGSESNTVLERVFDSCSIERWTKVSNDRKTLYDLIVGSVDGILQLEACLKGIKGEAVIRKPKEKPKNKSKKMRLSKSLIESEDEATESSDDEEEDVASTRSPRPERARTAWIHGQTEPRNVSSEGEEDEAMDSTDEEVEDD